MSFRAAPEEASQ